MHGETTASQRQDGKSIFEFLDKMGAFGKAGQRVVMREETDASIRLLFFLGSTVPGDGGNGDGAANEQTQGQRSEQESLPEMITLFGQVDIGRHDGLRTPIDDDREIGFRIAARGHGGGGPLS